MLSYIDLIYEPIMSTYTKLHVLYLWLSWVEYFHRDYYASLCFDIYFIHLLISQIELQDHSNDTYIVFYCKLSHLQCGLDIDGTSISHACTYLMAHIYFYHIRLTENCWELISSNWISDTLYYVLSLYLIYWLFLSLSIMRISERVKHHGLHSYLMQRFCKKPQDI